MRNVIPSLAIAFVLAGSCWGQGGTPEKFAAAVQTPSQAAARQNIPLTSEERSAIERTVLSDPRIKKVAGAEKPRVLVSEAHVDKAEAEAFISGRSDKAPVHTVNVVVFNPRTNQAVQTIMHLEEHRILELKEINASDVPLTFEDAEEAFALAKANPDVRRAVGSNLDQFVLVESGSSAHVPYAVQVLPLRSSDPKDPCHTGRCLDLTFRAQTGYLPLRVTVDLTRRSVKLLTRDSREEGRH